MNVPHSLEIWDNAARLALPIWLKAWLAVLGLTFASSLFFVRREVTARWAIACFITSHVLLAAIGLMEIATIRTGLVSLCHVICWTPALLVLVRALPRTEAHSPYGVWCRMLAAIILIAFVFDVRDAGAYLYHQATGHPALLAGDLGGTR